MIRQVVVLRDPSGNLVQGQCDASGNMLVSGAGGGGASTVTQGTAAAAAAPWSVELSDGGAFYTGVKTGQLPASLVGGRVDGNMGAWLGSTAPTVGSKTSANSIPVVVSSDQATSTGALRVGQVDCETIAFDLSTATGSAASTTVAGTAVTGLSNLSALTIEATLTGCTGGTCDVYIQHSPDGGTTWFDYAHYSQLAAGAAATTQAWNPAFSNTNTVVGKGTAGAPGVALAANTFTGGHPFDQMRLVTVTGAGVSAGVTQTVKVYGTRAKQ